jgi:hypothetical protein
MTVELNEAARWWRILAAGGRDANAPDDTVDDNDLSFDQIAELMATNGTAGGPRSIR